MKSIYAKITAILIAGFLLQIIVVGLIYKYVITYNVISDINMHETIRQAVLQKSILDVEKLMKNNPDEIQEYLNKYAKENNVSFIVKDMDGNTVYFTPQKSGIQKEIQEMGFVKVKNRPAYLMYAFYPPKLKTLTQDITMGKTKIYLGIIAISISLVISLVIYRVLMIPLKKLRRAVNKLDYGNTITQIPYYAKDEIGDLCRNFEAMGRRLQTSEKKQIELIQAVSHDLKTPLTSIIGFVKRLDQGKIAEDTKRKEYYNTIYRKAMDLKLLIEELDEYALLNIKTGYELRMMDLTTLINKISGEIENEVRHRGGSFIFKGEIHSNNMVMVDEGKIRRVFNNIIQNSFKYVGEGCEIRLNTSIQNKQFICEICDNGKGIDNDHLEKIFERFYRVDGSRSREKGGTGLGLAICREIIEGHEGTIGARNSADGGLCIYFSIPIKTTV